MERILAVIVTSSLVYILLFPVNYFMTRRIQRRIRAYLKQRGYEVFDITYDLGKSFLKHDGSYVVTYRTTDFELYKVRCHVAGLSDLFWKEPVHLRTITPKQWERMLRRRNQPGETPLPESKFGKEQIIDGLSSPYRYERVAAARRAGELDNVGDQIVHILRELSTGDPVMEVRETAQKALRKLQKPAE